MTKIKGVEDWYWSFDTKKKFGIRLLLLLSIAYSLWIPAGLWMVTVISRWALDGYYNFLVDCGWFLIFPRWLLMPVVISRCVLDGYCYFLVCSGWLLLLCCGLWVVAISWQALDGCCHAKMETRKHKNNPKSEAKKIAGTRI